MKCIRKTCSSCYTPFFFRNVMQPFSVPSNTVVIEIYRESRERKKEYFLLVPNLIMISFISSTGTSKETEYVMAGGHFPPKKHHTKGLCAWIRA